MALHVIAFIHSSVQIINFALPAGSLKLTPAPSFALKPGSLTCSLCMFRQMSSSLKALACRLQPWKAWSLKLLSAQVAPQESFARWVSSKSFATVATTTKWTIWGALWILFRLIWICHHAKVARPWLRPKKRTLEVPKGSIYYVDVDCSICLQTGHFLHNLH